MFELSIACKYLIPRWRQLSVSIISVISMIVISLVVWLILVFFSVANGLEKNWIEKLIAMTAPVRVTPTEEYYRSYYYNIDSISESSEYTPKSIAEKKTALQSDPYNPESDEVIPTHWLPADVNSHGELKDIVKEAFQAIQEIPGISGSDFEMAMGNVRLRVARGNKGEYGFINQSAFLGSFDPNNPLLKKTLLPIETKDLGNLLTMLVLSSENIMEESPQKMMLANEKELRKRLTNFFDFVTITSLQSPPEGWVVPRTLFPDLATLKTVAVIKGSEITEILLLTGKENMRELKEKYHSTGYRIEPATLMIAKPNMKLEVLGSSVNAQKIPLIIAGGYQFSAHLDPSSLNTMKKLEDLRFQVRIPIQDLFIEGIVPFRSLVIGEAKVANSFPEKPDPEKPGPEKPDHEPFWTYETTSDGQALLRLPVEHTMGEGIVLPKTFREGGVLLGDQGFLSYHTMTTSSVQEQRIPVYVAGFYDHGILPIGGKCILVSNGITSTIRSTYQQSDQFLNTGLNIRFDDVDHADEIKAKLIRAFEEKGIGKYWQVQTFREFDFTRDILQQIRSEKHLFSLIAAVIIIVACSNIISMLVILVNDKKMEIGILRAMGASSRSIALIFGLCGMIMGLVGSMIGIALAIFTLRYIDFFIGFIGKLQGYEVFNAVFYGDKLPNELSGEALGFVLIATAITSLLAGMLPALKASMVRPSETLRYA